MGLPVKSLLVCGSCAVALLQARLSPQALLFNSTWKTALSLSILALTAFFTWHVLLYPFFFSPLRNLPRPSEGNLILGHFPRIYRETMGEPQKRWAQQIPNDGLIYYRSLFNVARIIPTSPQALREVLSEKSYEFVKPSRLLAGIGQILGNGILLSEGDEHRVRFVCLLMQGPKN